MLTACAVLVLVVALLVRRPLAAALWGPPVAGDDVAHRELSVQLDMGGRWDGPAPRRSRRAAASSPPHLVDHVVRGWLVPDDDLQATRAWGGRPHAPRVPSRRS